jgi:hypothetical protein
MSRQSQWYFLTDNKKKEIAKKFQEPEQFDYDILLKHFVDESYPDSQIALFAPDVKDVYDLVFNSDPDVMKLVARFYKEFHIQKDNSRKVLAIIKLYKD